MEKSRSQLEWVQRNRARGRQVEAIGPLMDAVLQSCSRPGSAWRRRLMAVLEDHAGAELLDHVGGLDVRNGVLKLDVAEPALLYQLRLCWEQRLLDLLEEHVPAAGVREVRFVARTMSV